MFERFTDRSRRVVILSQENARLRKQPYIAAQNLLIGLYDEGEGVAASVMKESRFPRHDDKYTSSFDGEPKGAHLPFTVTTKKILELSLREALQLGHNYIGTEHILLACIRQEQDPGLIDWIKPGELRRATIFKLSSYTTTKPAPPETNPRERLTEILKANVAPGLLFETLNAIMLWHEGELPEAG